MRLSLFFLILIFAAGNLFAQAGSSLAAEIQNIERAVARQGVSAAERHNALVRLAQLRQLSGDIEGAARNWLEAAAAIPGTVDDNALLACAYCLAAMGEWDRAATVLEPLLSKNIRARFLDIGIKAIKTGDVYALAALAANPDFSAIKNEILFLLWKITQRREVTGERWRLQLISEFPQSPEGRLAAGQAVVNPSPFWLFVNGLDSLPLLSINNEQRTISNEQLVINNEQRTEGSRVAPSSGSVVVPPPHVVQSVTPSAVRLQTGVFGREANAQAHITALRQAGFSPTVERRGEMWAVIVPGGADVSQTISDLQAAGFESFPIR